MRGEPTVYRPDIAQKFSYTGTAGVSPSPFGQGTYRVSITATSACYYAIGTSPTATVFDHYLPAETPMPIAVRPGEKISAVQFASSGTFFISELTK